MGILITLKNFKNKIWEKVKNIFMKNKEKEYNKKYFDIIIPTYNNEEYTINCLNSIRRYTKNYRILWVDNGSSSESRIKVLDELKNHNNYLTIWLDKNYGFVKAVNAGLYQSDAEYVVFLNNDTAVTPEWFERLKYPFDHNPSVRISGPLTDTDGSWQGWRNVKNKMYFDLPIIDNMHDKDINSLLYKFFGNTYKSVNMVAFFCTLFKRELFDEIGFLDEDYGIGLADDDDICWKTKKLGYDVVLVPNLLVHHYHRTTFKKLYSQNELQKCQDDNIRLFYKKSGIKLK